MSDVNVNPVMIQRVLSGLDYPMTKDELVDYAWSEEADDSIISILENLPDEVFYSPADISEAIGDSE
ncbi:MAG TPA: DUF2795 domain-containing protein [Candidatus Saccharimonadales bacterium]|nr:DUF2795 domain-containing protein [Candidatus Saccharimonadales bacterium]